MHFVRALKGYHFMLLARIAAAPLLATVLPLAWSGGSPIAGVVPVQGAANPEAEHAQPGTFSYQACVRAPYPGFRSESMRQGYTGICFI